MDILILPLSAAFASAIGRISKSLQFSKSNTLQSFSVPIIIVILAFSIDFIANFSNNVFILTFILAGIMSILLSNSNRIEENNLLLSTVIGFHLAISYASSITFDPGLDVDSQRTDIGIAFISFWLASISVGFTLVGF